MWLRPMTSNIFLYPSRLKTHAFMLSSHITICLVFSPLLSASRQNKATTPARHVWTLLPSADQMHCVCSNAFHVYLLLYRMCAAALMRSTISGEEESENANVKMPLYIMFTLFDYEWWLWLQIGSVGVWCTCLLGKPSQSGVRFIPCRDQG